MSIIIRTTFSNSSWNGRCRAPYRDPRCFMCLNKTLGVESPKPFDELCSGDCWERDLCVQYKWGCTPKGSVFGTRAYLGAKVYFVFKQVDGNYTLWAVSTVRDVDRNVMQCGKPITEKGFSFIHFVPFKPLPEDQLVRNLTVKDLVGISNWRMGRHRYIDAERGAFFEQMIRGESELPVPSETIPEIQNTHNTLESDYSIKIELETTPQINDKLVEIAQREGRAMEDLVREAIAEWLRDREKDIEISQARVKKQ